MSRRPGRQLPWLSALLSLAALATGCPPSTPGPSSSLSPLPSSSQAALARPQIVTSAPALAEMVCALDGIEHLSGVSSYCVYPPALSALPQIGGAIDPNLEVIDGLAPDLVLLQGQHAGLEALAERRPWRIERFRVERIEDVFSSLERLGAILGKQEAAARESARLQAALAAIRTKRPQRAPKTLLVFGRRAGSLTQLSCSGEGTFLSECLEAAGGENCLAGLEGYPLVSTEVLVERAPELIIELFPEPVDPATRAALRADWARLGSLPAVAKGRIAIVSGPELLLPGPRLDKTLDKLQRVLAGEADVE